MAKEKEIQNAVIRHARDDMATTPNASQMHPEPQFTGFMDWVRANHAKQPSLLSELKAIAREAIKDIRATMNEVFFSKAEHAPEPGTPLNPTPQVVTADMGNFHGYSREADTFQRETRAPAVDKAHSGNGLYLTDGVLDQARDRQEARQPTRESSSLYLTEEAVEQSRYRHQDDRQHGMSR